MLPAHREDAALPRISSSVGEWLCTVVRRYEIAAVCERYALSSGSVHSGNVRGLDEFNKIVIIC